MGMEEFFSGKDRWQEDAYEMIKQQLLLAGQNRYQLSDSRESHLVVMYGKSQVGKTTAILYLIGIKPEAMDNVYHVLRADREKGNSSTSTAIIYAKSNTDRYGCLLTELNSQTKNEIQYFDENGMKEHLKSIRLVAENGKMSQDKILYIYIPANCFLPDAAKTNLIIVDLPGVGSRDMKEQAHIESLMRRYIPLSSVCLIVCESKSIAGLEYMQMPYHSLAAQSEKTDQQAWKAMPMRYMILVTRAYSDETSKKYLRTDRKKREQSFYDYIRSEYEREVRKYLGKRSKLEIFPLEVGESLTQLCNPMEQSQADIAEINDTLQRTLREIRRSVVKRKGQRLHMAIEELRAYIEQVGEKHIRIQNEQKMDKQKKQQNLLQEENQAEQNVTDLEEVEDNGGEIKELSDCLNKVKYMHNNCLKNLAEDAIKYLTEEKLLKEHKGSRYLHDKKESFMKWLQEETQKAVEAYLYELKEKVHEAGLSQIQEHSKVQGDALEVLEGYKDSFYPPKEHWYNKKEKVYESEIRIYCEEIDDKVAKILAAEKKLRMQPIQEKIDKCRGEDERRRAIIEQEKSKRRKKHDDANQIEAECAMIDCDIGATRWKMETDQKNLDQYLQFARMAYQKQRNEIIQKINSNITSAEKIKWILLLGLVDKDYRKVCDYKEIAK